MVKNNLDVLLLKSIPGVGNYIALVIASAIDGIEGFRSSENLTVYAGIVPSVRLSAEIAYRDRVTRRGSNILRWILVECVYPHVRFAPHSDVSCFAIALKKEKRQQGGSGRSLKAVACHMVDARGKKSLLQITVKTKVAFHAKGCLMILTAK